MHSVGISFVCQRQLSVLVVDCNEIKVVERVAENINVGWWWWCFILFCTFHCVLFWFNYCFPRGQTCRRLGFVPQEPLGFPRALPISVYFTLFLLRTDYGQRLCRWTVVIPTGLIPSHSLFHCYYKCPTLRKLFGRWLKIQSWKWKNRSLFLLIESRGETGELMSSNGRARTLYNGLLS